MDFQLNDVQRMMVESARQVGERFGLDYWREHDAKQGFPQGILARGLRSRLGRCGAPEAYGGSGLGMFELALIVDTLAATGGGSTVGQLFMINPIFGGVSISRFGSEKMKPEVLPKIISGEINCCMALTEPDAGTNSSNSRPSHVPMATAGGCQAARYGSPASARHRRCWSLRAPRSWRSPSRARDGLTMFMIDVARRADFTRRSRSSAPTRCDSSSVFFDDVRVEAGELIGTLTAAGTNFSMC